MTGYTIREMNEIPILGENGQPRTVRRVWFTTPRGTPASVDIDPADWDMEKINKIIAGKVQELDAIFDLNTEEE